jgi:outer membrane protein assembly factor BamB
LSLAADWDRFRGPSGACKAVDKGYATTWSKTENIKWNFALPGPGNSSPIVSNGRVFIICVEEKGTKRSLYCIDRKTGQQVWVKSVTHKLPENMHQTNLYSAATPAADGERVVVWHGTAGLFCYDFEGKELWAKNLGPVVHQWG